MKNWVIEIKFRNVKDYPLIFLYFRFARFFERTRKICSRWHWRNRIWRRWIWQRFCHVIFRSVQFRTRTVLVDAVCSKGTWFIWAVYSGGFFWRIRNHQKEDRSSREFHSWTYHQFERRRTGKYITVIFNSWILLKKINYRN